MKRREDISLISWQTRQLATYIAAGYMTDGKGNPALDQAQILSFDSIEEAQIEEAQKQTASSPGRDSKGDMFDSEGNIIPILSNVKEASFERFMGSMGSPSRWAGR